MKRKSEPAVVNTGPAATLLLTVLALAPTSVAAQAGCVPVPPGMVSWWPGEGDATDIWDGNPGIPIGTVSFTPGEVGQAFEFFGAAEGPSRVEIPETPNLQLTGPFTLDAWISFEGVTPLTVGIENSPIVAKWGTTAQGTAGYGLFVFSDGRVALGASTDGFSRAVVVSPEAIPQSESHHVAGVWTGSGLVLYVDGAAVASAGFIGPLHVNDGIPLLIGGYNPDLTLGADSLIGIVDEVELFDRALDAAEIAEIFLAGSAGKCKALVVEIDIKPGSDPNCFNINGHGVIPVAIHGSADFDVSEVDPLSLTFDGLAVRVRGKRGPLCSEEYSNGDGYMDLVCHFEDDAEYWVGGGDTGTVTGVLYDGSEFEGSDSICVVP